LRSQRSGHGRLIRSKPILRAFYQDAYEFFKASTPLNVRGRAIELGSGSGFIRDVLPATITVDILPTDGIDIVAAASELPFSSDSLSAIYLLDALHHFSDPAGFWHEAARCVRSEGVVTMVEPANTWWSRFVFQNFHHELFEPRASAWECNFSDPMMGNGAIPWIMLCRDKKHFASEFPEFEIQRVEHCCPLTYLVSGGLSFPQLIPTSVFPFVRSIERVLKPMNHHLGMFMRVVLRRR
jgi:SAM-dependent methyltransferase